MEVLTVFLFNSWAGVYRPAVPATASGMLTLEVWSPTTWQGPFATMLIRKIVEAMP